MAAVDATPGGQVDAVRALPAEWRARAEELSVDDAIGLTHQLKLKDCADELEAALASMPTFPAMRVTVAMVHAFEDAYCKNWEAQRHAPEGTKELGTFFATRAGLEAALSAQPSPGGQDAEQVLRRALQSAHDHGTKSAPFPMADCIRQTMAALAARQPVGWQPMETAPMDGTEILIEVEWRAGIRGKCLVGHYMAGGYCIEDHPPIDAGWYFWNGSMFDRAAKPMRWMHIQPAQAVIDKAVKP